MLPVQDEGRDGTAVDQFFHDGLFPGQDVFHGFLTGQVVEESDAACFPVSVVKEASGKTHGQHLAVFGQQFGPVIQQFADPAEVRAAQGRFNLVGLAGGIQAGDMDPADNFFRGIPEDLARPFIEAS